MIAALREELRRPLPDVQQAVRFLRGIKGTAASCDKQDVRATLGDATVTFRWNGSAPTGGYRTTCSCGRRGACVHITAFLSVQAFLWMAEGHRDFAKHVPDEWKSGWSAPHPDILDRLMEIAEEELEASELTVGPHGGLQDIMTSPPQERDEGLIRLLRTKGMDYAQACAIARSLGQAVTPLEAAVRAAAALENQRNAPAGAKELAAAARALSRDAEFRAASRTAGRAAAAREMHRSLAAVVDLPRGEFVPVRIEFLVPAPNLVSPFEFQVRQEGKRLKETLRTPQQLQALKVEISQGKKHTTETGARIVEMAASPYSTEVILTAAAVAGFIRSYGGTDEAQWSNGDRFLGAIGPALKLSVRPAGRGMAEVWLVPEEPAAPFEPMPFDKGAYLKDHDFDKRDTSARLWLFANGILHPIRAPKLGAAAFSALALDATADFSALDGGAAQMVLERLCGDSPAPGIVAEVPARARAVLKLQDGTLSLHAEAEGAGGEFFFWAGAGWKMCARPNRASAEISAIPHHAERAAAPPPPAAPEDAIVKVPRRADVESLEQWLRDAVPPRVFAHVPGLPPRRYFWPLAGKASAEFLAAWAERPANAEFAGNAAFAEFVTLRRPPEIKVTVEPWGSDWLRLSVEFEKELEELSLKEVKAALKAATGGLVMLSGGRLYERKALESYGSTMEALAELGVDPGTGEQRLHAAQLAGAQDRLVVLDADKRTRELAKQVRATVNGFSGIPESGADSATAAHLRPYQKQGVDFVAWAARTFGGALLADDMGLGKTLQVIAVLTALRTGPEKPLPSIVVCPASVCHNWKSEAQKFAPGLKVAVLASGAERKRLLAKAPEFDLIVTNYALARLDLELLQAQEWLLAVADEAQAIKNHSADTAKAVKMLKARHRIALTGTPVENRIGDLWSILDFAVPGWLGSQGNLDRKVKREDGEHTMQWLRARLRPILLRRLKAEVAPELPPRIEEERACEMEAAQKKLYLAEVKKAREALAGTDPALKGGARIQMLALLTRLRQICCSPELLGAKKAGSGKLAELLDVVPGLLSAGHKVLVFSQFVTMLEIIRREFDKEGIPHHWLTGDTANRGAVVSAFEKAKDPCVFLISLKAGGTGLNLVSASHVVLFDPWWNPAVEAQAIDRTHRIGQDKTVVALRLVTKGTVEERILELQKRKRALAADIFEEDTFNRALTRDDMSFLLDA